MSEATADTISVRCACGKKLKAPASAAGRKARCPKCGNVMVLEMAREGQAGDEELSSASADMELAPTALACPNCYQAMTPGAVLCTGCGFDTRTGQTLATIAEAAPVAAPPPLPSRAAATGTRFVPALKTAVEPENRTPDGSIIKGVIFSAVLAMVGAFIWFGIAKAAKVEIGWIAWGIGFAAGIGMIAGTNGHSVNGGMVAAAIAVGGIMLGKFMVFTWVVVPMMTQVFHSEIGKMDDGDLLLVQTTHEQLRAKGLDPENTTEAQDATAKREAEKLIAKMDAKTKATKMAEAKDRLTKLADGYIADRSKIDLFGKTMFSPMDILFVVLAVASAFKVATFGGEVDS